MVEPLQRHINSLKDSLGGVTANVGGGGPIARLEALLADFPEHSHAAAN
jgi:hypothetical protein